MQSIKLDLTLHINIIKANIASTVLSKFSLEQKIETNSAPLVVQCFASCPYTANSQSHLMIFTMHSALKNSIWAGMQQSISSTIWDTRDLWNLLSDHFLDQNLVEFLVSVLFLLTSVSGDQIKGSLWLWNKD